MIQPQAGIANNHAATRIIDPFAEQVVAKPAMLAADAVGQTGERNVSRSTHRTRLMAIIKKGVAGVLERAAIAAGTALALACDLLIAGDNARFHVAEVGMGMAAPLNTVWLELKFGVAKAIEFAAAGQPYSGRELAARGIALRSFPDDRVVEEARAYADLLAKNQPAAVAAVKQTIRRLCGVEEFRERVRRAQATRRETTG